MHLDFPTLSPIYIPSTVDNSAATLSEADIRLPLLATIPTPATRVVTDDVKPYRKRLSAIGMPVKSNFRLGYQGTVSSIPNI